MNKITTQISTWTIHELVQCDNRTMSWWHHHKLLDVHDDSMTPFLHDKFFAFPDSKVRGANMGPTWVRQDPGRPHVGSMNLAIWELLALSEGNHCSLVNSPLKGLVIQSFDIFFVVSLDKLFKSSCQ